MSVAPCASCQSPRHRKIGPSSRSWWNGICTVLMDACPSGTLTHDLSSETLQALELPASAFRKMPQKHEVPPPMSQIYQAQGPRGLSPTGIRRERGRARERSLASPTNGPRASPTREMGMASIMDPNTIVEPIAAPKSDKRSMSSRVSSSGLTRRVPASQVGSRGMAQMASQPRAGADGDEFDPNEVYAEVAPKTMARFASGSRAQTGSQVGSRGMAQMASLPRAGADGDEFDPNEVYAEVAPKTMARFASGSRAQTGSQVGSRGMAQMTSRRTSTGKELLPGAQC